ncbi:type II toxin-antitoxin system Phd/YefM family antitoxin [Acaryochloris marina NIES-2412]|uniref:type II toxin-antitoxin system Phd/YefM family antitoxin n=1 Tax=Acaryochloris marina TaxID=155978 RepID=UPI0040591F79
MYSINLQEAEHQLAKLIDDAARGENVIITRDDGTSFQLIPLKSKTATPTFGSAKGLIKIADNFDDPIEGFEEYTP